MHPVCCKSGPTSRIRLITKHAWREHLQTCKIEYLMITILYADMPFNSLMFLAYTQSTKTPMNYLSVLSQLPVTKRLISGIQARSLTGASCMATVTGCPPDSNGHILTCLSQPPENTVVPSSFQAEQRTCKNYKVNNEDQNTTARVWYMRNTLTIYTGCSCDIEALGTVVIVVPCFCTSQHRT